MNTRTFVILSLIVLGITTRFIPHWPNFTAVGAVALFGGAMFKGSFKAIGIPVLILFLSDLVINNVIYASFYESFQWFTPGFGFMYAAFILTALIGKLNIKSIKVLPVAGGVISSTLLFYLITNLGSWMGNPIYTKDFSGLMMAYEAGLPFLLNQIGATVLYSAILFTGAYYWFGSKELTASRA